MSQVTEKLTLNQKFEAKLSSKRRECLRMMRDIDEAVEDNFNVRLPESKQRYKDLVAGSDLWKDIDENMGQVIKLRYNLSNAGQSIAVFGRKDDEIRTYTMAHLYSKHRMCPVWNWRKSQLIRKIYKKYILDNELWGNYHPVHIVLTVPHDEYGFKNKRFYGQEILESFNVLRKYPFWQNAVYGGEYGLEVKRSQKNGMHIHVHSFTLLKKGVNINKFRQNLKEQWNLLTGGDKVWCETLYYYKKVDGNYETEQVFLNGVDYFEGEGQEEIPIPVRRIVKKKTYIDREIREIQETPGISFEDRKKMISEIFLRGVLECVKYHFKQDAMYFNDFVKKYDVLLMNDVLADTLKNRLYSRFGKFYKEESLNFNNIGNKQNEEKEEEIMGTAQIVPVDPFTGEDIPVEEVQFVIFKPEQRKYNPACSIFPFVPQKVPEDIFQYTSLKDVKEIIKTLLQKKKNNLQNNLDFN